jgi:hypothetical protein
MIAVLDTQGVEVFADRSGRGRARLRLLWRQVEDIVVPAAVLAEGVLTGRAGHDVGVHRLLRCVAIDDVTEAIGLSAGALRQQALRADGGHRPSGIDAIVAAVADRWAGGGDVVIVTSDEEDLVALSQFADNAERLSIERV